MFNKFCVLLIIIGFLAASTVGAQTLTTNALKVKAEAQKRALNQSRTKVKLFSQTTYVGIVSEVSDASFTVTDKAGTKYTVQHIDVKSIGGTGLSTGAKLGIGIAIGAGAVLGVLAAIVASDN